MTLTTRTPGLGPGVTRSQVVDEKNMKEITLLSDVKIEAIGEKQEDVIGTRGKTYKLPIGVANMLIASNQALEGKVDNIKPFPNHKAQKLTEAKAAATR
jgi:hypothetical protein